MPRIVVFRRAAIALAPLLLPVAVARAQDAAPVQPSGPAGTVAPQAPSQAPAAAPPPPASPPPPAPPVAQPDIAALRDEVKALRAEVEAARAAQSASPAAASTSARPPAPRPLGYEPYWPWSLPPDGLSFGGYVQSQYETHQDSQDQLAQGGALLNQDRFSVKRLRVNATGDWEYAAVALELDANTTNGPQVDLRKAEVSLQYRPDRARPPMLIGTLGQFDTPFGYELVESPRTRWFMERTTLSRAFWPGEPDLGLRLAGALSFFRWTIAGLNGQPLGEKGPYALQDPVAPKDVLFRFGFDATPRDDLQMAGGMSAIHGTGFHPGTDATGSTVQWTDANNDGVVQQSELTGLTPKAATPSSTFDRWVVGLDLRANFRWWPGTLKVYGEFVVAKNMDRGLYIADPVVTGVDQRELGYYVGFTQEVTRYGVVGLRYDFYDPNSDVFDTRGGKLIPYSEALTTVSPLVGLVLPDRARLLLQYDINRNALARSSSGVPTNLQTNTWTARLQVQL